MYIFAFKYVGQNVMATYILDGIHHVNMFNTFLVSNDLEGFEVYDYNAYDKQWHSVYRNGKPIPKLQNVNEYDFFFEVA